VIKIEKWIRNVGSNEELRRNISEREQHKHWYVNFSYWSAAFLPAVADRIIGLFLVFNQNPLKCNEFPGNMPLYFTFGSLL
jgi:hypothetical protein